MSLHSYSFGTRPANHGHIICSVGRPARIRRGDGRGEEGAFDPKEITSRGRRLRAMSREPQDGNAAVEEVCSRRQSKDMADTIGEDAYRFWPGHCRSHAQQLALHSCLGTVSLARADRSGRLGERERGQRPHPCCRDDCRKGCRTGRAGVILESRLGQSLQDQPLPSRWRGTVRVVFAPASDPACRRPTSRSPSTKVASAKVGRNGPTFVYRRMSRRIVTRG